MAVTLASELGDVTVFEWRDARTLEDELFLSLTDAAVERLIRRAIEHHSEELVNEHIKSVSQTAKDLNGIAAEMLEGDISVATREILGKAARTRKAGWFKSVTWMEDIARDIVGPDLADADAGFRTIVENLFTWANDAPR